MQMEHYLNSIDIYDIKFGNFSYKYYLSNGDVEKCIEQLYMLQDIDSFIIVSDKNVGTLYGQSILKQLQNNFKCELIVINCTEKNKNLQVMGELIEKILSLRATRRTCIIGLGGGICGNMAGMAAALLFRGIKFVHIPTSLIAVLDSVLSLKQAINSSFGKNLIGTYHAPEMVISDLCFLKTLPRHEIVSGMCEVIKNALAIVPDNIERLSGLLDSECKYTPQDFYYFINMSIIAKMNVMENDPYEKKDALILEYGHTIGHAMELIDPGGISHGESIGLGMLCAAEISHQLGYLPVEEVVLHKMLLERAGAPIRIRSHINLEDVISTMKFDNKRGYAINKSGGVQMVLLERIGKPLKSENKILTVVPEDVIRNAIINMYN